ncbi:MAG: zf-TFIIB domain-containing protein [Thiomonas sp.]|nr:zf-TFIIB domain-containing protein [Betaproteobacteria bacterium]MDE2267588.1 zf-TFIIB domain-containing protein [Betaproteobacteria bacterium]
MNCPHCAETTLVMAERHGIEIDYCPKCRGVWLDRGELDKIIERAAAAEQAAAPRATSHQPVVSQPARQPDFEDSDFRQRSYDPRFGQQPYKKRKSLLSDLFDFD